jgi:hypothetical protein
MATIHVDGRQFPLDDAIAGNDELLKQALVPHLPEIANATISRTHTDGQMVVTVIKKAGTKGAFAGLPALTSAPERINPVFGVAWMIRWNEARGTLDFMTLIDMQTLIDTTLIQSDVEEKHIQKTLRRLKSASASTSTRIVIGF